MKWLYNCIFLLFSCSLWAQESPVHGTVTQRSTGAPVPGITVRHLPTGTQTVTDATGRFTLRAAPGDTLYLTGTGLEPLYHYLTSMESITLTMNPRSETLEGVTVATGYQRIPRERATGAFTQLSTRDVSRSTTTDLVSRLEGMAPALLFDRRLPTPRLTVRGQSTLYGNAAPLIVVDQFPYEGDLRNINPEDIASITILKDAAAASIWGTRAANGVVVITTKRGRTGEKTSLTFSATTTVADKADLHYTPRLTSAEFIEVERFLFDRGFYTAQETNPNKPPLSPVVELLIRRRSGALSTPALESALGELAGVDVYREMERYLLVHPLRQQYHLGLSGGSGGHHYHLSFGYDRNREGSDARYHRGTVRLTNTWVQGKWSATHSLAFTGSRNRNGHLPWSNISPLQGRELYPYARLRDEGGGALPLLKDYRESFAAGAAAAGLLDWRYRPLEEGRLTPSSALSGNLAMTARLQYTLGRGFSLEGSGQYEGQWSDGRTLMEAGSYAARNLVNRYTAMGTGGRLTYGIPPGAILDEERTRLGSGAARGSVHYNGGKGSHALSAIAGSEIRQVRTTGSAQRTYGYNGEILTFRSVNYDSLYALYHNPSTRSAVPQHNSFSDRTDRFLSHFANAAYTYDNRYTLSGSARRDGSNLFGVNTNQKTVPLWSLGTAWAVHREAFAPKAFSELRLRLTYGYNGNVDPSLTALTTVTYFNSGNAFITGPYAAINALANPDLRWEKVGTLNAGLDIATKNGLLRGTVDYFRKKGEDLIGDAPVDPTVGWSSGRLRRNIGAMRTSGVETEITLTPVRKKLTWEVVALFQYNRSELTRYDTVSTTASSYLGNGIAIVPLVGKPLYHLFSYGYGGLDAVGDPQGYLDGHLSKDYLAISRTHLKDLVYNGPALPPYFGFLRQHLRYSSWELSVNIGYRFGYSFRRPSINYTDLFNNWRGHPDYRHRWLQAGDEARTSVPAMNYPLNTRRESFYASSEVLVERGDHIRLQDVRLSYTVSPKGRRLFKEGEAFLFAQHLGILWRRNKAGLDPDYYSTNLPPAPAVSAGIRTRF